MVERTLISFPSQLQLIERLQHLLYLSSSMIFISGEKGSGKSTLVEQLSNQLPHQTQQTFVSLSEPISTSKLRQQIISQLFDHPLFDADDTLFNTLLVLNEKRPQDAARIVIIDNASYLPEQLLIELSEVISQRKNLSEHEINFILLADGACNKEMIATLKASPSDNHVALLEFKLTALSHSESQQLLNHLLAQVGYQAKVQHQDALAKQLMRCEGIPEKILHLAENITATDIVDTSPSWIKTRLASVLLMLLLLAITALLGYFLYPQFIHKSVEKAVVVEIDELFLEDIQATDLVADEVSETLQTKTEMLAGQWSNMPTDNELKVGKEDQQTGRVIIPEQEILELANLPAAIDSEAEGITGTTEIVERLVIDVPIIEQPESIEALDAPIVEQPKSIEMLDAPIIEPPKSVEVLDTLNNAPIIEQTEFIETLGSPNDTPIIEQSKPIELLLTADVEKQAVLNSESKIIALPELAETQSVIVIEDIKEIALTQVEILSDVQPVPLPSDEMGGLFADKAMLLTVDPTFYTLQISGMSSIKSLQEFISKHQLPQKEVSIYQTSRNDKPWYVVIYGQYKNRQVASQASKNLPGSFSGLETWAKSYAVVQQDLQKNGQ